MFNPFKGFRASINLLRFRKLQAAAHVGSHSPATVDQLWRAAYALVAEGLREVYNPRSTYRGKDVSGAGAQATVIDSKLVQFADPEQCLTASSEAVSFPRQV